MPDLDQSAYIQKLYTEDYPTDLMIYTVLFYTWQLVYFSVITKEVMRYKRQLDDSISNLDQSQFYYMVRFITMLWIFNAALVVLYILLPLYLVDYTFLPILVNLIYFFILFFSYHHNAVFTSISFEKLNEVNEEVSKDEPENSRNKKCFEPTEKHLSVFEKLEELIEKDMIFIDPNLSIRSISSKIEAPEYVVSQTINHYFQKSFFDLINERRINEAKTRLQNMLSNETIEGIGYDVGFNSRSSFYRAFRKHVGKTPKQFVESSK